MPSHSLLRWKNDRLAALDEIEDAHAAVGGKGPGRRVATQQINQAYAMLVSSQFQGYCRNLHTEAVDHIVTHLTPLSLQVVVRKQLVSGRKLDSGNPNPGNLGADFGRLGFDFWPALHAHSMRTAARQQALEELNGWRNAIAHHDYDPAKLGGRTTLGVADVRRWRAACDGLATSFDAVLRAHLVSLASVLRAHFVPLVAVAPWQ